MKLTAVLVILALVVVGLVVLAVRSASGRRARHERAAAPGLGTQAEPDQDARRRTARDAERDARARGEAAMGEHIRRTPR